MDPIFALCVCVHAYTSTFVSIANDSKPWPASYNTCNTNLLCWKLLSIYMRSWFNTIYNWQVDSVTDSVLRLKACTVTNFMQDSMVNYHRHLKLNPWDKLSLFRLHLINISILGRSLANIYICHHSFCLFFLLLLLLLLIFCCCCFVPFSLFFLLAQLMILFI